MGVTINEGRFWFTATWYSILPRLRQALSRGVTIVSSAMTDGFGLPPRRSHLAQFVMYLSTSPNALLLSNDISPVAGVATLRPPVA